MTQDATSLADLHPRVPLVAAMLSVALPGLGQFYNGELNKAFWLFLAFVLSGVLGVPIAALYVPVVLMLPSLLASLLLTLGVWLGAVIDAWRQAARRQVYTRREWQVSGLYGAAAAGGRYFLHDAGVRRHAAAHGAILHHSDCEHGARHPARRLSVRRQAV